MTNFEKLFTKHGEDNAVWNVYPRPALVRDSFLNLNGEWDFAVTCGAEPENFSEIINVPFCPESLLSGINKVFGDDKILWYSRKFTLPEGFLKDRVLLHFGAVDGACSVFVNGKLAGSHIGGYEAFYFDITEHLLVENTVVVRVEDRLGDKILPYGKQTNRRGGMWYTPVSGIWQTVWVESVPNEYIANIKVDSTTQYADITFEGISEGEIELYGKTYAIKEGKVRISPENPECWSPENPKLYYFTVKAGEDTAKSYFSLRELTICKVNGINRTCLNGKPYFFHGVLDQGYWSDGLFTPANPECFSDDIIMLKNLGFNMLRKHIKVEPQLFYYECDRLGMAVFQDMVNNSDYSFWRDTALPTIGLLKMNDRKLHRNAESRKAFEEGMRATVKALYSHPSVCEWTIFNEGWGQFCADDMYDKLKNIDSSRFIDSASGWFIPKKTDFESRHIYFRKLKAVKTPKPYFISEFGGYAYAVPKHIFNPDKSFGYSNCKTREDFINKICALYKEQVIPLVDKGLCATVYTQLSDVEDEINGLVTFDRKEQKITPEEFKEISRELISSI